MKGDSSSARKASSDLRQQIDSDFKKAGSAVGEFSSKTSRAADVLTSFAGNLAADLFQNVASGALAAGKAILDYSARIEQLKITYTTLLGSAQKAETLLRQIQELSLKSPFDFEGLATLGQRLLASNVEMAKIPALIKDIGNVVAATGATTQERLEGVNTAISQIISKGRVSAEEMEQLAERGIPAWKLLSEAIGKTVAQTRKMAEEGQISSDVLLQAFQKMSREKFGEAMEKQSKTFTGAMNSIKNLAYQIGSTIFEPLYKEISKFAVKFADSLKKQAPGAQSAGSTFAFALGESIGNAYREGFFSKAGRTIGEFLANIYAPGGGKLGVSFGRGLYTGANPVTSNQPVAPDPMLTVPGMNQPGGNVQIAPTPEMLEKQRKEREKFLQDQLNDLKRYNELKIQQEQQFFEQAQKDADEKLQQYPDQIKAYVEVSLMNLTDYQQKVLALMAEGFKTATTGKTGQDLKNLQLEYANAVEKFNSEINNQKAEVQKKQTEQEKKASEERIKVTENELKRKFELDKAAVERRIALEDDRYKKSIAVGATDEARAAALEVFSLREKLIKRELIYLQDLQKTKEKGSEEEKDIINEINVLKQKYQIQEIKNSDEVLVNDLENLNTLQERLTEVGDKAIEILERIEQRRRDLLRGLEVEITPPVTDPGKADAGGGPGFFDSLLESFGRYLEGVVAVRDANGQLQFSFETMFDSMKNLGLQAFEQLTAGFATMVSNWVLYGDEAGNSLRKMVAQVLANLAATAAQYALMCLAAAALATTAWGAAILGGTPAQFLMAAAAFGALAVGAAVAGRMVAGDAFKRQTSGGYGTQNAQSQRSGQGGEVYSANRDKLIVDMARNLSQSVPQNTLVIESKGGLAFDELFTIRWRANGAIRQTVKADLD